VLASGAHKRPYPELLVALRTCTKLRAVPDAASATGYKLEPGPVPRLGEAAGVVMSSGAQPDLRPS
jgi:hypothetical protein